MGAGVFASAPIFIGENMSDKKKDSIQVSKYVFSGLCRNLEQLLMMKKNSIVIRTREDYHDVFTRNNEDRPSYPFAYLTLDSVSPHDRLGRPDIRARKGISEWFTQGQDLRVKNIPIVPTLFEMTLEYFTDDFASGDETCCISFIDNMTFAALRNPLDFNLTYSSKTTLEVKVDVEKSITVPKRDKMVQVSHFEFAVPLKVYGFVTSLKGRYETTSGVIRTIDLRVMEGVDDLDLEAQPLDKLNINPDS